MIAIRATKARQLLRQCKGCGKLFVPSTAGSRKGLYHSRECAFRDHMGISRPDPNYWLRFNRWKKCTICDDVFFSKWNVPYCSSECRQIINRKRARKRPDSMPCRDCGCVFVRWNGEEFISGSTRCRECQKAWHKRSAKRGKARRKLLMRGHPIEYIETINEEDVFCSQLWTCGICSEPVDYRLPAGHALSAELDHIRPLSKGGSHTRKNVQCTHRCCNGAKSDGTQDEAVRGIAFVKWITGQNVTQLCKD